MSALLVAATVGGIVIGIIAVEAVIGGSDVPQVEESKGRKAIWPYLETAERASGIKGLATFGLAASKRESGWKSTSANRTSSEAAAACAAWKRNRAKHFAGSPYDDAEHFCWGTGGWFGMMPGNGMAAEPFKLLDPLWAIFDPATQTAIWTAMMERVIRKHLPSLPREHRNWLSVRRAMASLATMRDFAEVNARSRETKERFRKDLIAVGVDPSFMFETASAKGYPGNSAVLAALQAIGGQS